MDSFSGPPDDALSSYVAACLARIGPYFSEPEVVQDALTYHRDLWESLYRLDQPDPASDFANPSS